MKSALIKVFLSVPVRVKIAGLMLLPVLILGIALNYWVQTGLSDWLSYLLSNERVGIAMAAGSRSVFFVTLLAAAISVLLSFLLIFVLTRPLLELLQVARQVADGRLESRARVWANDEIGEVAESVNVMIDRLVADQAELVRINQRLEALNRVAMAASRGLDLNVVLSATLDETLSAMGLQSGWVFLFEPDDYKFRLACQRNAEGFLVPGQTIPDGDLCACQQELLAGDLGRAALIRPCARIQALGGLQAHQHITIPLEARGQKLGMMNLVQEYEAGLEPGDLELLTAIGAQASEIIANAWLHARLVEKEAARQSLLRALVSAQEDERTRLSRELHDGAGQALSSLLLRLKVLEKQAESPEARNSVERLCQVVSETIEQIEELAYRLRPPALEEFGLEIALQTLVQQTAKEAGLAAECHIHLDGADVPTEIETALYRIAQECLTNIVRHAEASRVMVELTRIPYAICLRVEDDGKGFDPVTLNTEKGQRRLGLLGLQERTEMLGGSVVVRSTLGAGTSIQVRIPYYANGEQ